MENSENKDQQASRPNCKAVDCENPATKGDFCGWCANKVKKGLIDQDGNKILSFEEKKEWIAGLITRDKLRLYQADHPEAVKSFCCPTLNIFIEEVSCYRRIFIDASKKECRKCKIHEKNFPQLQEFLENTI